MNGAIVAIAGDPGGANAVAPVLELLQARGWTIRPFAYRQAIELWARRGIVVEAIREDLSDAQVVALLGDGASALLAATSVNGVDLEKTFIAAARSLRIPSLAVLDFWATYRTRFVDKRDQLVYLPDRIALPDEQARAEMAAEGIDSRLGTVTGQPAFDQLQAVRASFTAAARLAIRKMLGAETGERLTLFISQPIESYLGNVPPLFPSPGYTEHTVLSLLTRALDCIASRRRAGILHVIRPHPLDRPSDLARHRTQTARTVVESRGNPADVVLAADLVIGMTSVLLVEACLLGQVVISLQPDLNQSDVLPTNRSGASRGVFRPDEVEPVVEALLFDEAARVAQRTQAHRWRALPGAATRVADLLESMMIGKNRERKE